MELKHVRLALAFQNATSKPHANATGKTNIANMWNVMKQDLLTDHGSVLTKVSATLEGGRSWDSQSVHGVLLSGWMQGEAPSGSPIRYRVSATSWETRHSTAPPPDGVASVAHTRGETGERRSAHAQGM